MEKEQNDTQTLTELVSRQHEAIQALTNVILRLSKEIFKEDSSHSSEKRDLNYLLSSDFAVALPKDIDSLREKVGLNRMFDRD